MCVVAKSEGALRRTQRFRATNPRPASCHRPAAGSRGRARWPRPPSQTTGPRGCPTMRSARGRRGARWRRGARVGCRDARCLAVALRTGVPRDRPRCRGSSPSGAAPRLPWPIVPRVQRFSAKECARAAEQGGGGAPVGRKGRCRTLHCWGRSSHTGLRARTAWGPADRPRRACCPLVPLRPMSAAGPGTRTGAGAVQAQVQAHAQARRTEQQAEEVGLGKEPVHVQPAARRASGPARPELAHDVRVVNERCTSTGWAVRRTETHTRLRTLRTRRPGARAAARPPRPAGQIGRAQGAEACARMFTSLLRSRSVRRLPSARGVSWQRLAEG
jgi:hypothetical protein